MWEVIKKNKINSTIAFCVLALCCAVIYGAISGYILYCVYLYAMDAAHVKQLTTLGMSADFQICVVIGVIFVLLLFLSMFYVKSSQPYDIAGCCTLRTHKSEQNQLHNILDEMLIASGSKFRPELYILNSKIMNAYAFGLNPQNSGIVVSKGLLEELSRDELQGVIAHELSHIINRDTTYLFCSGIMFAIASGFTAIFLDIIRSRGNSKGKGFFVPLLLLSLIGQGISFLLMMFISRKREYLADASAALFTRYPKGLADALLKISSKNKGTYANKAGVNHLVRASFIAPLGESIAELKSTHPSTQKRIKVLMSMTSADLREYERAYSTINRSSLLPKSALEGADTVKIKQPIETSPEPEIGVLSAVAPCAPVLNDEDCKILKENKDIFEKKLERHRQIEDYVRDLAGYSVIKCSCGTTLKVPPCYKNTIVICPHCKTKHTVK